MQAFKVIWSEGIATFTLDKLCDSLNVCPNTIKIDTDGNEYKILKGALNTLKNSELRSLIIEMPHHNEKNLQKILGLDNDDLTLDNIKKLLTIDNSGKEKVFFNLFKTNKEITEIYRKKILNNSL